MTGVWNSPDGSGVGLELRMRCGLEQVTKFLWASASCTDEDTNSPHSPPRAGGSEMDRTRAGPVPGTLDDLGVTLPTPVRKGEEVVRAAGPGGVLGETGRREHPGASQLWAPQPRGCRKRPQALISRGLL